MNYLDAAILILLGCGIIIGYTRGFVVQFLSIAGLIAAYVAAFFFYDDLAVPLRGLIPLSTFQGYDKYEYMISGLNLDDYFYNAIAFALLFFCTKIVISTVGRLLDLVTKLPGLNFVNRWSGALLALVETCVIIIIAVNVLAIVPSDPIQQLLAHSAAAHWCIEQFPLAAGKLQQLWQQGNDAIKV